MSFWCCTCLLLLVLCCAILEIDSLQPKPLCLAQEKLALLRFKRDFLINCSLSTSPFAYPKVNSWQHDDDSVHSTGDCCSWDGVKCDEQTGHVVGLDLSGSCLYGAFPPNSTLFQLHHLLDLNLAQNHFHYSSIPLAIGQLVKLTRLDLSDAAFSGLIPTEIMSKLSNLTFLDLSYNDALHVMSLEKLVLNLTGLTQLHLDHVDIRSAVPLTLSNQTSLKAITLRHCHLSGAFPTGIFRLPNLEIISLDSNPRLHGHLPEFQSSSPLKFLSLSNTLFSGELPTSVANLGSLSVLNLNSCNFSGSIPPSLGNLTKLTSLALDHNHFSGVLPSSIVNITQLTTLTFSDSFDVRPAILKSWLPKLRKLTRLSLSNMSLGTDILPALTNLTRLTNLTLKDNLLAGQIPHHMFANLTHLSALDLSSNLLRGQLPIPPSSMLIYQVSGNQFDGVIPKQICNASSLIYLDLSENYIHGKIPRCLVGDPLGGSLEVLKLGSNKFVGTIPQTFSTSCKLKLLLLSDNQVEGEIPKSLARCNMLQALDIGANYINGTFPLWLGSLPNLMVLILRNNNFYGWLPTPVIGRDFRCMCLFDVSSNHYVGEIPAEFFRNWRAMKLSSEEDQYDPSNVDYRIYLSTCSSSLLDNENYYYGIRGISGQEFRMSESILAIDFSANKFTGRIPQVIGNDLNIRVLNLSNNRLVGCIPSSLGNIKSLEALDLSRNMLSGVIPQELTQLGFLAIFNVSYNHLVGSIPQENQFATFDDSSYTGNLELCGAPLFHPCGAPVSYSCENFNSLPPSEEVTEDDTKLVKGIIISLGCVSGFTIGFVLGKFYVTDRHHDWFVEKFGKRRGANTRARRSTPRRSRH